MGIDDNLKTKVIPELFASPADIASYGDYDRAICIDRRKNVTIITRGHSSGAANMKLEGLSALLEKGSVSELAGRIAGIVARLAEADPEIITRKPSAWARFFGKDLESRLLYERARRTLEEDIATTQPLVANIHATLEKLNEMEVGYRKEVARLNIYIEAGKTFLAENPQAGLGEPHEVTFDRPRERFARKLTNLAALLASHEMGIQQIRLAKAQAIDMLDRWHEITTLLLPVWQQQTLMLLTTRHMSAEMIGKATQAHRSLLNSLQKLQNS